MLTTLYSKEKPGESRWSFYPKRKEVIMKIIHTTEAPKPIGPYSQAMQEGRFVWTSGQLGIDPQTGELVSGSFEEEVRQVLANLRTILKAAGCTFQDVVKTTIYLVDLGQFTIFNQLYEEALGDHRPARTTLQVSALPKGANIEIDMVAIIK